MRRSNPAPCYLSSAGQKFFATSDAVHWHGLPPRRRSHPALAARASNTSNEKDERNLNSRSRRWTSLRLAPKNVPCGEFRHVSQVARWKKLARLGQGIFQQSTNSTLLTTSSLPRNSARTVPDEVSMTASSKYQHTLAHLAQVLTQSDGPERTGEILELLQEDEHSGVLSRNDAQTIREEILTAALTNNSWLNMLVDTAHYLLVKYNYQWPDLYMRIMHHMLENGRLNDSIRWHLHLAPKFLPSVDIFCAIISSFILDASPRMQRTLAALYVSSTHRHLYDYIIPVLFAAGRSKLARLWRKRLIAFGDFPRSSKSTPFLHFIAHYYPSIALTQEERTFSELANPSIRGTPSPSSYHDYPGKGHYMDGILAKWFASSWASVDFAIHFAERLGLRMIGPRSLQALALREPSVKMVASRLARIEKLGVTVSNKNYCKVLAFFAKHKEGSLLADLLACDIHPDEFDQVERRQMLMATSVRNGDWRRQRLLQGIEWAIESEPSSCQLHSLLQLEMAAYKLGRTRQVLDRMEALSVSLNRETASRLLEAAFRGVGKHSAHVKRRGSSEPYIKSQSLLNGAIDIVRRVALHDVAIPLRYWTLLLLNLGRSGRLDELQQLSEEIVQLYSSPLGGLVPICVEDFPSPLPKDENTTTADGDLSTSSTCENDVNDLRQNIRPSSSYPTFGETTSGATIVSSSPDLTALRNSLRDMDSRTGTGGNEDDAMLCIPADLPLSHRQHPVQHIFDASLQRSIVRWGFDKRLTVPPASPSLEGLAESGVAVCDITSGVRLLARLRDLGVLIDLQVLRAAVLSKIALGQLPGRERDRSRDRHELSPERLKCLFEEAWGSEIFPSVFEMRQQLEKQKPKLWARYPKLFGQSFDKRRNDARKESF